MNPHTENPEFLNDDTKMVMELDTNLLVELSQMPVYVPKGFDNWVAWVRDREAEAGK